MKTEKRTCYEFTAEFGEGGGEFVCSFDPADAIPISIAQKVLHEGNVKRTTYVQRLGKDEAVALIKVLQAAINVTDGESDACK